MVTSDYQIDIEEEGLEKSESSRGFKLGDLQIDALRDQLHLLDEDDDEDFIRLLTIFSKKFHQATGIPWQDYDSPDYNEEKDIGYNILNLLYSRMLEAFDETMKKLVITEDGKVELDDDPK